MDERVTALRARLRETCLGLGKTGGDAAHARLLEQSFLVEPRKQLAIAHDLGMGLSTYRKHLAAAIQRVADRLWEKEMK